MNKKQRQEQEVAENKESARKRLTPLFPPGKIIYTISANHCRNGGFDCYVLAVFGGEIENASGEVADLIGERWQGNGSIYTGSAFDIVQRMSYALHGDKTVGIKAKRAERAGAPCVPTPSNYKGGYSLIHQAL